MTIRYELVVTEQLENPDYEVQLDKWQRNRFGDDAPVAFTEQRRLSITLSADEFNAVRLAVLNEMQPKNDVETP